MARHPLQVALDKEHGASVAPLVSALDEPEVDSSELTKALDAIPDAWDQAELGCAQGLAGQTTPLDQL